MGTWGAGPTMTWAAVGGATSAGVELAVGLTMVTGPLTVVVPVVVVAVMIGMTGVGISWTSRGKAGMACSGFSCELPLLRAISTTTAIRSRSV